MTPAFLKVLLISLEGIPCLAGTKAKPAYTLPGLLTKVHNNNKGHTNQATVLEAPCVLFKHCDTVTRAHPTSTAGVSKEKMITRNPGGQITRDNWDGATYQAFHADQGYQGDLPTLYEADAESSQSRALFYGTPATDDYPLIDLGGDNKTERLEVIPLFQYGQIERPNNESLLDELVPHYDNDEWMISTTPAASGSRETPDLNRIRPPILEISEPAPHCNVMSDRQALDRDPVHRDKKRKILPQTEETIVKPMKRLRLDDQSSITKHSPRMSSWVAKKPFHNNQDQNYKKDSPTALRVHIERLAPQTSMHDIQHFFRYFNV
ncbi:hypothetical protein MMC09_000718 [Bachmanniomyces sp. S44760]|nr:hypothetical protein [Bachmanniomyces sp. S44760]